MKAMLIVLSLLFSVSMSFADTTCQISIQKGGGVDTWPWSVAQPFPWSSIQGVWKLNTANPSQIYFRMQVVSSNSKRKLLNISKIENGNCSAPIAKGVGYIAADEKNVVRAIMADKNLRYQLKLAMFDLKDLANATTELDACTEPVLAASMQVISGVGQKPLPVDVSQFDVENMVLKKISNSLDSVCKKPVAR